MNRCEFEDAGPVTGGSRPVVCRHCGKRTVATGILVSKCGNQSARGLGDTVARITSAIGIKPCQGCRERQATLNRWVPYKMP